MQRQIGLWCLIGCLFAMASTATAEDRLPDLMPVVVDANRGEIEVRNIGNAAAEPSQLYVVCSTLRSGKSEPCAAGLHLPGYIEKWNTLPFDIPALQPGSKYPLDLLGDGGFPPSLSRYYMVVTSDPLKRIVEWDESNNQERLNDEMQERGSAMGEFVLFLIMAAIAYWWFIRRAKAMAPMMGELAKRGMDIDAQVVKKFKFQSNFGGSHRYLVYSFTLESQQSFSKKISPSVKQWDSIEEGDTLPVVYLAEDPNVSTTKDMVDQIKAAMPEGS